MNKNQKPPFKQNAIALSFTLGVHAIAIVGLLFLGLSKPPEQPKKLTTVLVKPEDLPPPLAKEVEQPTVAENQAEEVLSPIVDETLPQNLPAAPPPPTAQQLAAQKQKAEQAQQAKLAEEKRKAEEAAKAKQAAEQQRLEEAQKQQAEAKRQAEAKARAEAEQKRKAEQNAKAEADAKARQKATEEAKRKAET
ncbi:TPA: cell envelope integrity protein TolA, partial [Acinetobacter baumannii]|nr:cell envelope integrity protein TolA [Acinetobacter baumannii]